MGKEKTLLFSLKESISRRHSVAMDYYQSGRFKDAILEWKEILILDSTDEFAANI